MIFKELLRFLFIIDVVELIIALISIAYYILNTKVNHNTFSK